MTNFTYKGLSPLIVTELKPLEGQQKSFYKKAHLASYKGGFSVLWSYDTPIILWKVSSGLKRKLWGGWTKTTSKHIKAFVGRDRNRARD